MRAPIQFIYGNCVFARGPADGWAAFAVDTSSYTWLSDEAKRARMLAIVGAIEALEADVQILRVSRRWPVRRYESELRPSVDAEDSQLHGRARRRYVEGHANHLADMAVSEPRVYLLVSLREPERDVASYVS